MAGGRSPWLIAIVISIATFMEVLDTSIANVALRHVAGALSAGVDESTWVLTSYLVSNAIVLPISGFLANVIGRKKFYMLCVALFTGSSLLCGLAPSLSWLIFFRVLQGIGGGGLAPSEQSMLADTFKPEQRGYAFALYGIAVVFAPAIGPTLGGWITDNYSWRWIFLINVPFGLLSLLLSGMLLTEPPAEKAEREKRAKKGFKVDYVGFGLIAIGLGCLQIVLDKGQREDWFESRFIILFSAISLLALVAMVIYELWTDHPIVDLRLFKYRSFASSCALMFALGYILFGTTQMIPQFTQDIFGYTATRAGLVITPGGIFVIFMMPLVAVMLKVFQPRLLIALGMLIEIAACWHLSTLDQTASYENFMFARIYQAAGLAFLFVPISTVSYAGLPPSKTNDASAMTNLMRNLGGGFGISLAQTWIAQKSQLHQNYLVHRVTETNPVYQHVADVMGQGGPGEVGFGVVTQMVLRQASILAYLDTFRFFAVMAVLALPLVFLLKPVKPGAAAGH